MDIRNISNYTNNKVNSPETSNKEIHQVNPNELKQLEKSRETDKLSVSAINKDELSFAKVELEKLNKAAMENISEYRQKIRDYQEVATSQMDKLKNNELHQRLNDPEVWSRIADKIQS